MITKFLSGQPATSHATYRQHAAAAELGWAVVVMGLREGFGQDPVR
jgi:hypothetical protein